jgi:hypothetical protein
MTGPLEVTIRVHPSTATCVFCRAEVMGSEQQWERVVGEVHDSREADTCSLHGQALAAMVQAQGGQVLWEQQEG